MDAYFFNDAKVELKDGEIKRLKKLVAYHSDSAEIPVLKSYVFRIFFLSHPE